MPMSPHFNDEVARVFVDASCEDCEIEVDLAEEPDTTVYAIFDRGRLIHVTSDPDEASNMCAARGYSLEVQDEDGNMIDEIIPY